MKRRSALLAAAVLALLTTAVGVPPASAAGCPVPNAEIDWLGDYVPGAGPDAYSGKALWEGKHYVSVCIKGPQIVKGQVFLYRAGVGWWLAAQTTTPNQVKSVVTDRYGPATKERYVATLANGQTTSAEIYN